MLVVGLDQKPAVRQGWERETEGTRTCTTDFIEFESTAKHTRSVVTGNKCVRQK